jgi:uncharacterized phage protein (TIGR02218 family)
MKNLSPTYLRAISKVGRSTCFCVKIVSTDNTVLGFTTLDASLTFNDGFHTVKYDAYQELRPQNIQQEANFESDNTELTGWFTQEIEQLVLAGILDVAEVTIYRVLYLEVSAGLEVVGYGTVGSVDLSADGDGKRKVEFLGLTQKLQRHIIDLYSLTCRASFGDERCTMPLTWTPGTISAVGDNPLTSFTISGVVQPDDYYILGVIMFTSGKNSPKSIEVETWKATGEVTLSFPLPYPAVVGDSLKIRRDCDKTETMCKAYGNIINMRAEHLMPVEDQALMVPGAYIKSVGAQ